MSEQERERNLEICRRWAATEGVDKVVEEHGVDVIMAPCDSFFAGVGVGARKSSELFLFSHVKSYKEVTGYLLASIAFSYVESSGRSYGLYVVARANEEDKMVSFMSAWKVPFRLDGCRIWTRLSGVFCGRAELAFLGAELGQIFTLMKLLTRCPKVGVAMKFHKSNKVGAGCPIELSDDRRRLRSRQIFHRHTTRQRHQSFDVCLRSCVRRTPCPWLSWRTSIPMSAYFVIGLQHPLLPAGKFVIWERVACFIGRSA
jgi:hypothetical protein